MVSFKTIVCIESTAKFTHFLDVIKQKHKNIQLITGIAALYQEILSKDNTITIVFIDHVFLNQLPESFLSQSHIINYLFIALFEEYPCEFQRAPYIYDIIECQRPYSINNFLIRLENDINSRIELDSLKCEIRKIYNIGKALSSEKDIKKLLELIIDSSMEITSADAGTIYVMVDDNNEWSFYEKYFTNRLLKFTIAKNKSIQLDLESATMQISKDSIFGYSVITGQPTRIDDAYNISENVEYQFNNKVDKITGYRTKSILTVPMKDHENRVIGIIQLINKKAFDEVISFSSKDEMIICSLAGEAAVALENNILYKNMENLLEKYRLITSEEINKRQQADEEINKLLSAIEHSPSTVIITDIHGNIQYVNPKFTHLTGYTYKEVIGKTPKILNSGKHSAQFYDNFWTTINSGKDWSGEFYNRKKNGEYYWESASISSVRDENGLIKYFIAVKEDISEKKLIANKLEDKNRELLNTLQKLNEAQAQLLQKEKMAAIGQLAAGVAHEINNPLGFVMSNFGTLEKYAAKFKELLLLYRGFTSPHFNNNEEKDKLLEAINNYEKKNKIDFFIEDLSQLFKDTNEGLERVKNVINALRSFSHIDQLNDFTEFNLNEGIETTLLIAKNSIKYDANIYLDLNKIPLVTAIGGEINQVILNLILNAAYAIKIKSNRDGVIKIKTYQQGEYVCCEVEDNGTGIEKENLNRLFEPFYTTKPVGEGTGLGLSISYDIIVKKHNGEFLVDSKLGVGTKFTIMLPVHTPAGSSNN